MVAVNSHYYEDNTCHWQTMCQQTVLIVKMLLREKFFSSISLRMMINFDKSAAMEI